MALKFIFLGYNSKTWSSTSSLNPVLYRLIMNNTVGTNLEEWVVGGEVVLYLHPLHLGPSRRRG